MTLANRFGSGAGALGALLLTVASLALPANGAGQELDLSGDWVFTVESPNGTGKRDVTFVQEGNKLTGQIMSSRADGDLSGTIDGDQLTFVAIVQMESGAFEITYNATVTGNDMTGTVDFGDYGVGTFRGHRVEKEPS